MGPQNSSLETHNFQDGIGFSLASLLDQRLDRDSKQRMDPARSDLGSGLESETSLVEPWMGDFEVGSSKHRYRYQQQIEVEGPWPAPIFSVPLATGSGFEFATALEQ